MKSGHSEVVYGMVLIGHCSIYTLLGRLTLRKEPEYELESDSYDNFDDGDDDSSKS